MRHLFVFFTAILLSISALAQVAPRRDQPPSADTAKLTGQVVRTDTGEPIPKADVTLIRDTTDQQSRGLGYKTETDTRGNFAFDRILPGRYIVSARVPGYVGSRGGDTSSAEIALSNGSEERAILRLAPTPVIVGHVLDEDGIPLREAQVKVIARTSRGLRVLRTATADERGEYRLYGFPPGKHLVCAVYHERRNTDMRYPPRCFPDTSNVDDASPIKFVSGEETPLNFVLFPARTTTVHGVVSGVPIVEGHLLAGVEVKLEPKWQAVVDDLRTISVGDASGKFDIRAVLPGSYRVVATAVTPKETLSFRDTVEIRETGENNLVLELSPANPHAVQISGSIRSEDPQFRFPINSIQLEFRPLKPLVMGNDRLPPTARAQNVIETWWQKDPHTGARLTNWIRFNATIDSGYTYLPVLTRKPAGTYLKDVFTAGRREVSAAGFNADNDVRMELILSNASASIEGDVFDSHGVPGINAVVIAIPDPQLRGRADIVRTASDQHGHFILHDLAPGDYTLYAFDSLGGQDSTDDEFLDSFSDRSQDVKATPKATTNTELSLIHLADTSGN